MVERGRGGGWVPPYCEASLRQTTPTSTDAQAWTTTTTTTMTLSTRGKNNFFLLHILFNIDFGVLLPRAYARTWPSHPQHPLDFNPPPCPPSHAWHNQTATAPPRKWLWSGSTPQSAGPGRPLFLLFRPSVPAYSFLVAFESSVPSPPHHHNNRHPSHTPPDPTSLRPPPSEFLLSSTLSSPSDDNDDDNGQSDNHRCVSSCFLFLSLE